MSTFTALPRPATVMPHENFTLDLTFTNGERRVFDALPYLQYPALDALTAISLFMQARVEHHTVVWNDEIDMAPKICTLKVRPCSGLLKNAHGVVA
jgi:hypothetical protein